MISLFLNTSSKYLNVALVCDGKVIGEVNDLLDKDVSRVALPYIKEIIENNSYKPSDIDNIVCVNGPGSFTGLRVGVTIAKTYAYSLKKDLYSVSSLFVMATSIKDSDFIVPLIDARRNFVYGAIYDKDYNIVYPESYIGINKLKELVSSLKGKVTYVSLDSFDDIKVKEFKPDIANMFKFGRFKKEDYFRMVPNYLKKPEAEEKLGK